MNKQNIWFVSLFSIILILCIYYISIPSSSLNEVEPIVSNTNEVTTVSEISDLVGLRVENDEMVLSQIENLQNTIVDKTKTTEEKNIAYEQLKNINQTNGKQEEIEKIIKKEFNYDSFVKIENDQISIVIKDNNHDSKKANDIIRKVQSLFTTKKYITIKFS